MGYEGGPVEDKYNYLYTESAWRVKLNIKDDIEA